MAVSHTDKMREKEKRANRMSDARWSEMKESRHVLRRERQSVILLKDSAYLCVLFSSVCGGLYKTWLCLYILF